MSNAKQWMQDDSKISDKIFCKKNQYNKLDNKLNNTREIWNLFFHKF